MWFSAVLSFAKAVGRDLPYRAIALIGIGIVERVGQEIGDLENPVTTLIKRQGPLTKKTSTY